MENADAAAQALLRIEVAYSPAADAVECVALELPAGATLVEALQASGLAPRHGLDLDTLSCGVWGRRQSMTSPLSDGDRVEIYRPLQVDPKEARRLRYKAQRITKPTKAPAVR